MERGQAGGVQDAAATIDFYRYVLRGNKKIRRCLKGAISREIYRLLTDPPAVIDASELRPLREAAGLTRLGRGRSTSQDTLTTYRDYLDTQQHAA